MLVIRMSPVRQIHSPSEYLVAAQKFVRAQVGDGETCSLVGGRISLRAGTVCQPAPAATGCIIVASDLQKLNFGKNAAISGDGNWIAVSEDYIGGVFVFGRWVVAKRVKDLSLQT